MYCVGKIFQFVNTGIEAKANDDLNETECELLKRQLAVTETDFQGKTYRE